MSHFSVLVITKDKPSNDELAKILRPWHEFESTGVDDQYVVDVDMTETRRKDYETGTVVRIKGPDGVLHDRFNEKGEWKEEFSQPNPEAGPLDANKRVEFIPPGYERVEVPCSQVMTFREYCADRTSADREIYLGQDMTKLTDPSKYKYGYTVIDETAVVKDVRRTNPNAKWDWWQVGGRYTGKFAPHYDPNADPANLEPCQVCQETGLLNGETCNGCQGKRKKPVWPTDRAKVESDQIQIKDIPFQALADEREQKAAKTYDEFHRIVAGRPVPVWSEIHSRHEGDADAARKEYWQHPVIVDLTKSEMFSWGFDDELATLSREEYLTRARARAVTAFAVVKDGQWYEQGKMGWWAIVTDAKDGEVWQQELNSMLQSLSPTDWVTVVDCHI
jgi:hypothetical protein